MAENKQVTMRGAAPLPGLLPGAEADNLAEALLVNAWPDGRGGVALVRLPSAIERVLLQRRKDELEKSIEPIGGGSTERPGGADWARSRQALGAMFAGRSARRETNIDETLDIYLGWLSDLPAFAIIAACMDIGRGKARLMDPATGKAEYISPTFDISATILHLLASKIADVDRQKLTLVERVLRVTKQAPAEASPELRKRLGEEFKALGATLRSRGPAPVDTVAEAQARLDAAAAEVRAIEAARADQSAGAK